MIGILNSGGDFAEDLFASARRTSLYKNTRRRSRKISYGASGRVFIGGQPRRKHTAEELWDELLKLTSVNNVLENALRLPDTPLSHISRSDGDEIYNKAAVGIMNSQHEFGSRYMVEVIQSELLATGNRTAETPQRSKLSPEEAEQIEPENHESDVAYQQPCSYNLKEVPHRYLKKYHCECNENNVSLLNVDSTDS